MEGLEAGAAGKDGCEETAVKEKAVQEKAEVTARRVGGHARSTRGAAAVKHGSLAGLQLRRLRAAA